MTPAFNCVNDIEEFLGDAKKDEDSFNMVSKYHLQYDLNDSWGNIRIYEKELPKGGQK